MEKSVTRIFRSRISIAIALLIILLFGGVVGFKLMSNYTWIDAIYMTVITITTVGFGEVHPLGQDAKIFTICLILTSVIIVGYALKIITEYIVSKNDISKLKHKRMQKKLFHCLIILLYVDLVEMAHSQLKNYAPTIGLLS